MTGGVRNDKKRSTGLLVSQLHRVKSVVSFVDSNGTFVSDGLLMHLFYCRSQYLALV
jgi:hypothetical protein